LQGVEIKPAEYCYRIYKREKKVGWKKKERASIKNASWRYGIFLESRSRKNSRL